MGRFRRLAALPWQRRRLLAEALALMPLVVVSLGRFGLGRTGRLLRRLGAARRPSPGVEVDLAAMAWAARASARQGPWGAACLAESLVLWWMLRRRGVAADIRLGVAVPDRSPEAHAWVEVDGQPVNDTPEVVQRFRPLAAAGRGVAGAEVLFRGGRRA